MRCYEHVAVLPLEVCGLTSTGIGVTLSQKAEGERTYTLCMRWQTVDNRGLETILVNYGAMFMWLRNIRRVRRVAFAETC